MDQNYPILYLYGDSTGSNGDACRVRIMFGRERNEPSKNDDPDWICPSVRLPPDFGFQANRSVSGQQLSYTNPMFQVSNRQTRCALDDRFHLAMD